MATDDIRERFYAAGIDPDYAEGGEDAAFGALAAIDRFWGVYFNCREWEIRPVVFAEEDGESRKVEPGECPDLFDLVCHKGMERVAGEYHDAAEAAKAFAEIERCDGCAHLHEDLPWRCEIEDKPCDCIARCPIGR